MAMCRRQRVVCSQSTGSTGCVYQVVTQVLYGGLHNHVFHCRHLCLNSLFLYLIKQLQNSKRQKCRDEISSMYVVFKHKHSLKRDQRTPCLCVIHMYHTLPSTRHQARSLIPASECCLWSSFTFTTLRIIRLKSPISWPEGSSISFSSWSTDLCCKPSPKRRAWRAENQLE